MDIKIGFTDNPRELVISTSAAQDEVVAQVSKALKNDFELFDFTDDQGRRYLIRNTQIAYVEVGTTNARTVGFSGV
ncbi:Protein of uncharacterised function (DUF3107) [Corynebacterium kutscheri]|uniref:Protein of uncharacterized function (DUF3107) n=1 Tax=Corynebacterium kutscheri TaxID=35755 RepID=A0A0F6R0W8_9CORY|nr:DUF3107 domain-containing protein [Corynebacterium kutscheri]AKE41957.1 Protein of unknown function (DUF3107) [Corynebacterium kutscheri]VEH06291.1 Protein of uncharacterised function (DUF3107) [Corynebacterium kutscheri]VEH10294.1 Protein of uncharacterised function (DUF3107) [Corynebacterium kutscheri]VEH82204.1 Protein of uncharacterised function (DUF3107) [Corynebacterium kutscheri]